MHLNEHMLNAVLNNGTLETALGKKVTWRMHWRKGNGWRKNALAEGHMRVVRVGGFEDEVDNDQNIAKHRGDWRTDDKKLSGSCHSWR